MFHTHSLKQQRIARWIVGLVMALATLSIAFVASNGLDLDLFSTQQSVAAPGDAVSDWPVSGPYELYHMEGAPTAIANPGIVAPIEPAFDAPVSGPYEMYHMEGAPTAIGKPAAPEVGDYQTPWDRYHCSGCP